MCLLHQLTLESFWGRNHDKKRFDREWSAKTIYKSDESFRNSSNDSVSSSDNEIDDTAVADAGINDKGGDEEETLHQDYMWEIMDNYRGLKELYNCDFGPSNGAENISDIVEHYELFFDKEIVWETNRYEEHVRQSLPISLICEIVDTCDRKWNLHCFGSLLQMHIMQKPSAHNTFWGGGGSTPGCAMWFIRHTFELICQYLHFIKNGKLTNIPRTPPHTIQYLPCDNVIWTKTFKPCIYQTKKLPLMKVWHSGRSVCQTVPTTRGFQVWNKNFQTVWINYGILWCFLVYIGKNTVLELSLINP